MFLLINNSFVLSTKIFCSDSSCLIICDTIPEAVTIFKSLSSVVRINNTGFSLLCINNSSFGITIAGKVNSEGITLFVIEKKHYL